MCTEFYKLRDQELNNASSVQEPLQRPRRSAGPSKSGIETQNKIGEKSACGDCALEEGKGVHRKVHRRGNWQQGFVKADVALC